MDIRENQIRIAICGIFTVSAVIEFYGIKHSSAHDAMIILVLLTVIDLFIYGCIYIYAKRNGYHKLCRESIIIAVSYIILSILRYSKYI